ncbi:MAG: hypothetical protein GF307_12275 [candidate division Zixibacteria bacterium]|nr:hypothetical protein [candidate division Zixibacteria bacterium]
MLNILKIVAVVSIVIALGLMGNSCGERSNPAETMINNGTNWLAQIDDTASLWFNYLENTQFRDISIYTPPGYVDTASTEYPVLYLLHGFNGNDRYFFDIYDLKETADEMISNGEIVPMIIATIDASSQLVEPSSKLLLGGWYTDTDSFGVEEDVIDTLYFNYTTFDENGNPTGSTAVTDTNDVVKYFAGLYEQLIVRDLKNTVEATFNVSDDRGDVGIGGHSMGGYGAMKIAMKYPGLFGSVSSMSAPLAFNGDGSSFLGLREFIPSVLAENSITGADSASIANYYDIDTDISTPLTNMMLSMAAIFSPLPFDSAVYYDTLTADTSHFVPVFNPNPDSVFPIGVLLPFNWTNAPSSKTVVDSIWNQWLEHDCLSLFDTLSNPFGDSIAIYMDCGADDELYMKYHMDLFAAKLTASGVDYDYTVYSGYENVNAGHANMVAYRLREVLKFHSEQFSQ